jgi:NADH-quinone oxidoreductase subunit N
LESVLYTGVLVRFILLTLAYFLNHHSNAPATSVAQEPLGLFIALGCIMISLLFKLGSAPFHTFDVYEGSSTHITAFFAICAKIAVLSVLIRLTLASQDPMLMVPLAYAAGLSLLVGSISAMRQTKIKRLLALSGVANVGWFYFSQWSMGS